MQIDFIDEKGTFSPDPHKSKKKLYFRIPRPFFPGSKHPLPTKQISDWDRDRHTVSCQFPRSGESLVVPWASYCKKKWDVLLLPLFCNPSFQPCCTWSLKKRGSRAGYRAATYHGMWFAGLVIDVIQSIMWRLTIFAMSTCRRLQDLFWPGLYCTSRREVGVGRKSIPSTSAIWLSSKTPLFDTFYTRRHRQALCESEFLNRRHHGFWHCIDVHFKFQQMVGQGEPLLVNHVSRLG